MPTGSTQPPPTYESDAGLIEKSKSSYQPLAHLPAVSCFPNLQPMSAAPFSNILVMLRDKIDETLNSRRQ